MTRFRWFLVVFAGLVLVTVLLEWTVKLVDTLKVGRFADFRALAAVTERDRARPRLVPGAVLRVQDGRAEVQADARGDRSGLSIDGETGGIVAVGSGLAFGYGASAPQSFLARTAIDREMSLRVFSHPFVERADFAPMLEAVTEQEYPNSGGRRLLVLVDRLQGGLSTRLRAIRDHTESRSLVAQWLPSISQVVQLASGDVREEKGSEDLGPIEPALEALADSADRLRAHALFVTTGGDPLAVEFAESLRIHVVELQGQADPIALHPLHGFPDSAEHAVFAARLKSAIETLPLAPRDG